MVETRVHIDGECCPIIVRPGMLSEFGAALCDRVDPTRVCVLSDDYVGGQYGPKLMASLEEAGFQPTLHCVPPGEASKQLPVAQSIYEALGRMQLDRDGLILALGGGVVSDLAGFVAATWLRGIRFAVCPTTMEAVVDASIGGKNGVNTSAGKNLVGTFLQPRMIGADPDCLKSLPPRDIRAGLGESLKHGLIASEQFLDWQEEHADEVLALDGGVVSELILRNIRIKTEVVSFDPLEQSDVRIVLNYGHTIGHAIESSSGYRLRHGECVGLGMVAAGRLAEIVGVGGPEITARIERALARFELPCRLEEPIDPGQILDALRNDKKTRGRRQRIVLLEDIGETMIYEDATDEQIVQAYESLLAT